MINSVPRCTITRHWSQTLRSWCHRCHRRHLNRWPAKIHFYHCWILCTYRVCIKRKISSFHKHFHRNCCNCTRSFHKAWASSRSRKVNWAFVTSLVRLHVKSSHMHYTSVPESQTIACFANFITKLEQPSNKHLRTTRQNFVAILKWVPAGGGSERPWNFS